MIYIGVTELVDPFSREYFSEHVSFVFNNAPLFPLNALSALSENITGAGVYGLYYTKKLAYGMTYGAPVYVGKALVPGSRKGNNTGEG
jgi:hypothetical protein